MGNPQNVRTASQVEVQVYGSFAALPAEHRELLGYATQQNIFHSIEWFGCLKQYGFAADLLLRIYVAHPQRDRPDACILVCAYDKLGGTLRSLTNFYTMEFGPIFLSALAENTELLNHLIDYIAQERPRWTKVHLEGWRDADEMVTSLGSSLKSHGFRVNAHFHHVNQFADIRGQTPEAYYKARPSKVRYTIERGERQLQGRMQVRFFRTYDPQAIVDYRRVYSESWKQPEQHSEFIPQFCKTLGDLGLLRMGILYVDDVAAAAQIWFLSGKQATIYKVAYDEAFAQFSVGSILIKHMFHHVLKNDQVDEVSYGTGSEGYKKNWTPQKRVLRGIEAFNMRTLKGLRLGGGWMAGHYVARPALVLARRSLAHVATWLRGLRRTDRLSARKSKEKRPRVQSKGSRGK